VVAAFADDASVLAEVALAGAAGDAVAAVFSVACAWLSRVSCPRLVTLLLLLLLSFLLAVAFVFSSSVVVEVVDAVAVSV
jgi:predicted PurR-regulated permease PerM